jgi:hydrogenase maturation protease
VSEALNKLLQQKDKKKLFVGIGNVLKMDDGVGVYICRQIAGSDSVSSLAVETSIENYIGKINSLNPDILILIDCMDLNQPPGSYRLMGIDEIVDQTFNTHNISLNRLGEFFPMPVRVLGIQPQHIDFGESLSCLVKEAADRIIGSINREEQDISF